MNIPKSSSVIKDSWLPTYDRERDVFWWQLVELNCSVFIIEKIEAFPFHLFLPIQDDRIFWRLTKNALIEKSIMIIYRVVADESNWTIKSFKNNIYKNLIDDQAKAQLGSRLKAIDFDTRIANISTKVKDIRNNFLAHLDRELHTNPDPRKIAELTISLIEIKDILATIVELFDTLCFDNHHSLWYWGYLDSRREDRDTDIDRLLDSIAKESRLLNMPEEQPEVWHISRQGLSTKDLETLNIFRRRFGLAEV